MDFIEDFLEKESEFINFDVSNADDEKWNSFMEKHLEGLNNNIRIMKNCIFLTSLEVAFIKSAFETRRKKKTKDKNIND